MTRATSRSARQCGREDRGVSEALRILAVSALDPCKEDRERNFRSFPRLVITEMMPAQQAFYNAAGPSVVLSLLDQLTAANARIAELEQVLKVCDEALERFAKYAEAYEGLRLDTRITMLPNPHDDIYGLHLKNAVAARATVATIATPEPGDGG